MKLHTDLTILAKLAATLGRARQKSAARTGLRAYAPLCGSTMLLDTVHGVLEGGALALVAEELQEHGREGARNVKRWLEATLRFELPYNVYASAARCTLALADGSTKLFDLAGDHYDELRERARQVYVEVKNARTVGNLSTDWIDFVAHAYSATHVQWDLLRRDPELEFMFASTNPWNSSGYWKMTDPDSVIEACGKRVAVMPDGGLDETRARVLAERLFLWVVPRRQDDMTMGNKFRGYVMSKIAEDAL